MPRSVGYCSPCETTAPPSEPAKIAASVKRRTGSFCTIVDGDVDGDVDGEVDERVERAEDVLLLVLL